MKNKYLNKIKGLSPNCHSEERIDEESLFSNQKQIPACRQAQFLPINRNQNDKIIKLLQALLYLAMFIFLSTKYFAQGNDDAEMVYFYGGNLRLNLSLGFTSFSSGSFGGVISSSTNSGSASVFGNPTFLANSGKADIKISFQPEYNSALFGIDKNTLFDEKTIGDATDGILEDNSAFTFSNSSPRYDTQVGDFGLYQGNGLGSISIAYPIAEKITIGIGYNSPVNIDLGMSVNNISTNIRTVKTVGGNDTQIDMILYPSVNFDMEMRISQLSISAGAEIFNDNTHHLTAGISFNRYFVSNKMNLSFRSDGMIVLNNGNEYFFNDPYDENLIPEEGETNDLFWTAKGNFTGSQSGMRLGAWYHSNTFLSFLSFSSVIDIIPEFILRDESAYSESYQPKFFTGMFTGSGDNELDIVMDSIDLAKPNLTRETENNFDTEVRINFPTTLTLGVEAEYAKHVFTLNYVEYFGDYSYKFDKYKAGFTPGYAINFGADFTFPGNLEGWNFALIPIRLLFLDFDGL
ncbi:MAG: hypothetical protein WC900_09685, partial [Oscillospiraceae bacterium]